MPSLQLQVHGPLLSTRSATGHGCCGLPAGRSTQRIVVLVPRRAGVRRWPGVQRRSAGSAHREAAHEGGRKRGRRTGRVGDDRKPPPEPGSSSTGRPAADGHRRRDRCHVPLRARRPRRPVPVRVRPVDSLSLVHRGFSDQDIRPCPHPAMCGGNRASTKLRFDYYVNTLTRAAIVGPGWCGPLRRAQRTNTSPPSRHRAWFRTLAMH